MIRLQTSLGDIVLEMNHEHTPKTAENFEQYVKDGFYDGLIFHRVIKNFMIQGGGFDESMQQKTSRDNIKNEAATGGSNARGTIAMARTPDPHSASSQFFINVKDNDFLNYRDASPNGFGYCVFGKVIEGMDIVDKIEHVATGSRAGHQDVPLEAVKIIKATVE
jgi:peptidyl-prolyl cis-trans isomerase B (cyclophilin B)